MLYMFLYFKVLRYVAYKFRCSSQMWNHECLIARVLLFVLQEVLVDNKPNNTAAT